MKLELFKTIWGFEGDFEDTCIEAEKAGFSGIECKAPEYTSALHTHQQYQEINCWVVQTKRAHYHNYAQRRAIV